MKPIIVTQRHPTPVRYFVTKYEFEILKNQAKRQSRARERDSKYMDIYDCECDNQFITYETTKSTNTVTKTETNTETIVVDDLWCDTAWWLSSHKLIIR